MIFSPSYYTLHTSHYILHTKPYTHHTTPYTLRSSLDIDSLAKVIQINSTWLDYLYLDFPDFK